MEGCESYREDDFSKLGQASKSEREKKHEEFLRFWSGRDVQVVAGEILKWSCGKRSVKDGDGRHLFAPEAALSVTCGAAVFKLPTNEYKAESCIGLDNCTHTRPTVACIENYNKLKCALPEFFK
ncbi:unnamed protein product [Sphagnum balticum]